MLGIKYSGPVKDGSGYAEFARSFIAALDRRSDVKLTVEGVSFEKNRTDHGEKGKIVERLLNKNIPYKLKVLNLTPNFVPKLGESGKINIPFTMFETTKIPQTWVDWINSADACFVPCQWNKEVFKDSGVKKPVYVCHPGADECFLDLDKIQSISFTSGSNFKYSFYSIFQWTERKNPLGLLKAYLAEFDGVGDVVLVLKTYGSNNGQAEQDRIKKLVKAVKESFTFKHFAPAIIFVGGHLSREEILGLHKSCDCFVLPHRAEGFGLPHFEAMAMGKPVITTGFSGNMDFCTPENSFLLDHFLAPVHNMRWINHYEADMEWAEPNLRQLRDHMRALYEDRKVGEKKGELARKYVLENFTWEKSAQTFVDACIEVADG